MIDRTTIVAIVEDDADMRKGIERLLGAHGFETEAYSSGEAFLNRVDSSRATCLVIDIHLTGMSGIELTHRLASSGAIFSVIFMTAADSEKMKKEAVAAGCLAYLRKPFPANQLIDAIAKSAA